MQTRLGWQLGVIDTNDPRPRSHLVEMPETGGVYRWNWLHLLKMPEQTPVVMTSPVQIQDHPPTARIGHSPQPVVSPTAKVKPVTNMPPQVLSSRSLVRTPPQSPPRIQSRDHIDNPVVIPLPAMPTPPTSQALPLVSEPILPPGLQCQLCASSKRPPPTSTPVPAPTTRSRHVINPPVRLKYYVLK